MGETALLAVEALLVDPSRFSPRVTKVDAEQLDQLAGVLAEGGELPPLRVARLLDSTAEWCGCPQSWSQQRRAAYQARGRAIPHAVYPIAPEAVLIDGLARYWAFRERGAKQVPVTFDDAPATGVADVLARALEANSRHGRRLADADLRTTFCRLWLGREPRASHERWTPAEGALPATEIAQRLGRTETWCADMIRVARVVYTVGLELSCRAARAIGRLEPGDWHGFVWTWDDQLRTHPVVDERGVPTGDLATVPAMSARDVERLVEAVLKQLPGAALPAEPPSRGAPGESARQPTEPSGQYILEFEWDALTPAAEVRRVLDVVDRLAPALLLDVYGPLQQLQAETTIACQRARARLRAAGLLEA